MGRFSARRAVAERLHRHGRVAYAQAGVAVLMLFALALSACGGPSTSVAGLAKNQVFVWPYANAVDTMTGTTEGEVLDPALISLSADIGSVSMLYTGLVTFDSGLRVAPDAALKWDVDPSATIYTFHLRHDMHFNDGKALTADDFAYSIDRALDPTLCTVLDANTYGPDPKGSGACNATPSPDGAALVAANYLGNILGASKRLAGSGGADQTLVARGDDAQHGLNVLDQYTLRIRLAAPAAYFLEALTYPTSFPVERSLVEKYPGGKWVDHLNEGGCSGPFQVQSYGGGKQMTFVPNPAWSATWGKHLTLTEVDRPLLQSADDEYAKYQTGQYDYTDVPGKQYQFARGQDDFSEVPTLLTQYFGLNLNKAPFTSTSVRQAFDLALNKQLLVDRIFNGGAIPTNHIVPNGMPGYNATLKNPPPDGTQSLTGNQDAAVKLIQDAAKPCTSGALPVPDYCAYISGAQKKPIKIWYNGGSATRKAITTAAAQSWSQLLGLDVVATAEPSANTYFGNIAVNINPYQGWAIGWIADYPDAQDWLTLQFHSGMNYNASNVASQDLDALLEKADKEVDTKTRIAEYNQAEQAVVNQCAWIPFAQGKGYWRQRHWVHGFGLNGLLNMVDINWPNVYIAEH